MPLPAHRPATPASSPSPSADNAQVLLERILETPSLAQAIPRLQPELLHRVIERCGLEDCGALVALVTPAQLSAVFDLDLWRSPLPGSEEKFDADRFGLWLEVLLDSGAESAASTLAALDAGVVTTALGQFVRVYDPATLTYTVDDEVIEVQLDAELTREIGGYQVAARRGESWDAIVEILIALNNAHGPAFHRVMQGCRDLSNSGRELDGLDDLLEANDQDMFDRAVERDRRREQQGYIAPAQARAFLRSARTLPLGVGTAPPSVDPIAAACIRDMRSTADETPALAERERAAHEGKSEADDAGVNRAADAALIGTLIDGGVLPQQVKGLLGEAQHGAARLACIRRQLAIVAELDADAYSSRQTELAFLANALVAGCSIQSRAFTPQEASDAAVAICNLGLEQWPAAWLPRTPGAASSSSGETTLPDDFLVEHDLVSAFQIGWTLLHEQVCMFAARALIAVLKELRCNDADLQKDLNALRRELARHVKAGTPWDASESLEVITSFDLPAWAALHGLIAECPTAHAALAASNRGVHKVSPTDFEFFAEGRQVSGVHAFMATLHDRLSL